MTATAHRSAMPQQRSSSGHSEGIERGQQDAAAAPQQEASCVAPPAAPQRVCSTSGNSSTCSHSRVPSSFSLRRPPGVLHILLCLFYSCSTAPYTHATSYKLNPGSIIRPADPRADAEFPAGYVGICAVAKDQPDDIREWVEYHRWLGAGRIYLYDNRSKRPMGAAVMDYIKSGFVEYQYFSGLDTSMNRFIASNQAQAYINCIQRFKGRHRWLAFIDVDEFIVLHKGLDTSIAGFMKDYEDYAGLAVHWLTFGGSGHKERPTGGVLANYVNCMPADAPINRHIKTIANTRHLVHISQDPHTFLFEPGSPPVVNQDKVKVPGAVVNERPPVHSKIALYHYIVKSEAEFQAKVKRGSGDGGRKDITLQDAVNKQSTQVCTFGVRLGLMCCQSTMDEVRNRSMALQPVPVIMPMV